MRFFAIICIMFCAFAFADTMNNGLKPLLKITTQNAIISAALAGDQVFVATANGTIEIYDTRSHKLIRTIKLPMIKDGFSDILATPRVINSDTIDGEKIVILSDDTEAGKAVYIWENGKLNKIFSTEDNLNISKAYMIDQTHIIIATLGHEIKLYDIEKKREIYSVQPYWSMLIDFIVSSDRKTAISASEGGVIYLFDIANGKLLKEFHIHKDLAMSIAFANGVLISGGADLKMGVVNVASGAIKHIDRAFSISAVAISPSGKIGAAMKDEANNISVFNTDTLEEIAVLNGGEAHQSIRTILFLNEKDILVFFGGTTIQKWRLK
ncbi:hypothetical protein FACS189487_07570 [Campylobacterota bacterium]|nr:hypothetical protein FACS189487_07570 [Campylobacterota bacterium]